MKDITKKKDNSVDGGEIIRKYEIIKARGAKFDFIFFFAVCLLVVAGLVTLFSASSYSSARDNNGNELAEGIGQLVFAGAGFGIMLLASAIDYQWYKFKTLLTSLFIVSVGLNVAVLVPGLGLKVNGALRWLQLGPLTFQPSEFFKITTILIFSALCAGIPIPTKPDYTGKRAGLKLSPLNKWLFHPIKEYTGDFIMNFCIPFLLPMGIMTGILALVQHHMSATIILFCLFFGIIFVSGRPLRHLLGCILPTIGGGGIFVAANWEKILIRIQNMLNPESDISGKTYQTYNSLLAIAGGGFGGVGITNSKQKYGYIPESANDFIFSIGAEEFGFAGAIIIIIAFLFFTGRGFYIAAKSPEKFTALVAFGISLHLGLQALLNIGVVTSAIPNTGISLPFFSRGGTALIIQLAECGIILGISRKSAI